MDIQHYINAMSTWMNDANRELPWHLVRDLEKWLLLKMETLDDGYRMEQGVAIHATATIEQGVVLKGPIIIEANAFVAAHAYLRGGVFIGKQTVIGPGCEIKSSLIFNNCGIAHFNFIGDSLVGSHVNVEAGAVTANHYNERTSKQIKVNIDGNIIETGVEKFGALIGDESRIGANAVLMPGSILPKKSIVNRLQLLHQVKD